MDVLAELGRGIGGLAARALDLALPAVCAGCEREGAALCEECETALDARLELPPGTPIGLPGDVPAGLAQIEWCASFTGVPRRALHRLKYAGDRRLAEPLGRAVGRRWARAGAGGDAFAPVPASPDRVRDRGYDQADLIARAAGRDANLPVWHTADRGPVRPRPWGSGRECRGRLPNDVGRRSGTWPTGASRRRDGGPDGPLAGPRRRCPDHGQHALGMRPRPAGPGGACRLGGHRRKGALGRAGGARRGGRSTTQGYTRATDAGAPSTRRSNDEDHRQGQEPRGP
jgi:predicted amidophosphoribosyltransferase